MCIARGIKSSGSVEWIVDDASVPVHCVRMCLYWAVEVGGADGVWYTHARKRVGTQTHNHMGEHARKCESAQEPRHAGTQVRGHAGT